MSNVTNLTQIKAILDTIDSNLMGSTFKYFETKPTKLPAGMIMFADQPAEEFFDSNNNLVTYVYTVRSIFAEEESQVATEKWAAFLDAVQAAFRTKTNSTFGGAALKVVATGLSPFFSDTDYTVPALVFDIQIEVKMLKSIT